MDMAINIFLIATAVGCLVVMRRIFNKRVTVLFNKDFIDSFEIEDKPGRASGVMDRMLKFVKYVDISLSLLAIPLPFYMTIFVVLAILFRPYYELGMIFAEAIAIFYILLGSSLIFLKALPELLRPLYYLGISSIKEPPYVPETRF